MIRKIGFLSLTATLFMLVVLSVECKKNDESEPEPEPYTLPVVSSIEPSNITDSTAISGGKIISDGRATIASRGVCWSTNVNPNASDPKYTIESKDTGIFVVKISGLILGTKYHLRAYARNSVGIAYGEDISFTTRSTLPDLVTTEASALSATTAVCGGNITGNEGTKIISRGICWSISQNPTIQDSKTTNGISVGSFISNIFGLAVNTTYYVRAYATNFAGTAYGNEISFKTQSIPSGKLADADGNLYDMITIGNQTWMGQNLKTTHFPDGTIIPLVTGNSNWGALTETSKAYCWHGDNINNKENYGVLYTWSAAMNGAVSSTINPSGIQGVCPTSWHLPSDAEWTELTDYLDGENVAGGKIKEIDTVHWKNPNVGATNESSFTAIGGGYRDGRDGFFYNIRFSGSWWSATESPTMSLFNNIAYSRQVYGKFIYVQRLSSLKKMGYSIRCIKD